MRYLVFGFLATLVLSCSSYQPIVSENIDAQIDFGTPYRYYNSDNKVRYHVLHDSENLYLRLGAVDKNTSMKILRGGLTIYLDSLNEENEYVYVKYPIMGGIMVERPEMNSNQRPPEPPSDSMRGGMGNPPDSMGPPPNMGGPMAMGQSSGNAIFHDTKNNSFSTNDSLNPIQITLEATSAEEVNYELKIPFTYFARYYNNNILDFSIGIESGNIELPSEGKGGPPNGGGQGGPPGGGGSMGAPPSGGQGGPPGGGGGPGGGPEMGEQVDVSSIDFWIHVSLQDISEKK